MLPKFQTATTQYMMFGMNTTSRKFLKKSGTYQNSLIIDDDRKLIISGQDSRNIKENFPNQTQKYNVSLTLYHEANNKNLRIFGW